MPTNSQIVLSYLMKAEWATLETISKKTMVKGSALAGTIGHLVRTGKVLHVNSQSGCETIYVYLSKKKQTPFNPPREEVKMKSQETKIIGAATAGGYFGGIINVNGTHKGVIWAPKQQGQIRAMLLPSGQSFDGAGSPCDCASNMQALLDAGSPAAQQIAELNINGFNDWLIPSRDVLELGYRHFKPTRRDNYCSWRDGENPNSVPPGWLYTDEFPAQTTLEAFKDGGDEAFDDSWYFSSTVLPHGNTAFDQDFDYGYQGTTSHLSAEGRVRAVRLIQLGS
jgi:hypothetical protein